MKTRTLGESCLGVSALGLGCMGMSWSYHPIPDRKGMLALLRQAAERGVPRFSVENRKANQVLVDLLRDLANRKEATPGQVALAWLLAQGPWIVPVPGTTKQQRLEENIGAARLELTPIELRAVESAASKITIQGDRNPEQLERLSNR
jgi:aryl-alcohol dehydrogenase-like predicted oxidoreductase